MQGRGSVPERGQLLSDLSRCDVVPVKHRDGFVPADLHRDYLIHVRTGHVPDRLNRHPARPF